MSLFKKSKKLDPKIPDAISLKAGDVVIDNTPHHEKTLDSISVELQERLKKELRGILGEVVDQAIDNTKAQTEQMLRNQLMTMLETRLDQLVEQAIKKNLARPKKLPDDS